MNKTNLSTEVASLELCKELYELTGWEFDQNHRRIGKVWIESFSTSEMGQGHEDYNSTPPEKRRQYHIGEYEIRDNPKNFIGIPESVPWGWANKYYEETIQRSVPAYSLGYLLRKLPRNNIKPVRRIVGYQQAEYVLALYPLDESEWGAGYDDTQVSANTPEDAVALLCIELKKQNIL